MERARPRPLRRVRPTGVVTVAVALVAGVLAVIPAARATTAYPSADRIGAGSPVAAAVAISQERFDDHAAPAAVLARDDAFPDALGASAVAAHVGGPLLFTDPGTLSSATRTELQRVMQDAGTVYLMGGTQAIATSVEDAVDRLGYTTPRFAGTTRVETAALAARRIGAGPEHTAILARASGSPDATQGWVDSVSCGAYAARTTTPVLLTPSSGGLHPATRSTIERLGITHVFVCGGTAAVPRAAADDLVSMNVAVDRYAGRDRVATAVDVARRLWQRSSRGGSRFVLVPGWGDDFGYGLAAAGLAADRDAPILLVGRDEPTDCDPSQPSAATICYLAAGGGTPADGVTVVAPTALVSDTVLEAAARAAGLAEDTTPPPAPTGTSASDVPEDDGTQLAVSWQAVTDDSGGEVSYTVHVRAHASDGFSPSDQDAAGTTDATQLTVTGLTAGQSYDVVVVASDAARNDSSPSNVATATPTDEIPAGPTKAPNLQAGAGSVTVAWQAAPEADAAGYVVQRGNALLGQCPAFDSLWQDAATVDGADTTTYTDDGVSSGQSYCYRTAVVDTTGNESDPSPASQPVTPG